ncbi:hypothetical protein LTR86_008233 [Recurvomyces mirabilis]|nr:hypothetical protein LTR86_008233 [Recurvomyces mirabilis]
MVFSLTLLHAGLIPAISVFLLWCLPGAIGMFALALGVARINSILPVPVYALLSGLNAATVGIIALAAVQLASKAITDPLARILVILGACAGLCYSALWYFPVVVTVGGAMTAVWDVWLSRVVGKFRAQIQRRRDQAAVNEMDYADHGHPAVDDVRLGNLPSTTAAGPQLGYRGQGEDRPASISQTAEANLPAGHNDTVTVVSPAPTGYHGVSAWRGLAVITTFFASFIAILVFRSVLNDPPRPLDLFANMYLAGTIIFGGGPVVIPLLREYVVQPGWVSPRDFLLGLAIIQAFPGPNFNFAVYLSTLAIQSNTAQSYPPISGAILGLVGMFSPGLVIAYCVQGLWRLLRTKPVVTATLRGVNATAVGLIFTAVYRLWEQGYLMPQRSNGQSLAMEPWWVVVATIAYSGSCWFRLPPAVSILAGGTLGLLWYAATQMKGDHS